MNDSASVTQARRLIVGLFVMLIGYAIPAMIEEAGGGAAHVVGYAFSTAISAGGAWILFGICR
jgi:hypothetical protein